ncbi:hypothetical protein IC757_01430 [Wenzhouxiangella sp. AB-CW3]|uniref:hypothetical protein n=1 Tax=Wenzhouxiangella sp. AB-CW3 TaxID=2771012 RepID=UPI00168BE765|nr:hypothetical protein [Wenzhouxiangella sp. AB-CW3]QOC22857.1 hypothetical protein IC757_01430 [Wenzhouxiangella sp. AB-CW3]
MTAAGAQQVDELEPAELRAPLLESVIAGLNDEQRHVVFDLGVVRSGTVSIFSDYRCRLDVMALEVGAPHRLDQIEAEEFQALIRTSMPPARGESVDLFLCWNLLNYLSTEQIGMLLAELTPRFRPGARLHALIEYSARTMPASPPAFNPVGPGLLEVTTVDDNEIAAPRYSARDLEQRMPGFEHERTMLLGGGMQEYLFRRRSA